MAQGHLFWGPWMCDCNLTLVGVVSLAPAGDFDFARPVPGRDRLEASPAASPADPLEIGPSDWPTLRANNARTAVSQAAVPGKVQPRGPSAASGLAPPPPPRRAA